MSHVACSVFSEELESLDAGRGAAEALLARFGAERPQVALVYATMNHDQPAVLEGVRQVLGAEVTLLGCSVQGVVSNDELTEDGLALGLMGFGGSDVHCAAACEREIQDSPKEKGKRLAQTLKRELGGEPKVVFLFYDPLCGLDVEAMLEGLRLEVDCPLVGGAAGQPWGPPRQTFQYWDREVFSHGVIALGLSGPFACEVGICHGTAPTGISSVVTKAVGNHVLEIDGRRATDVWRETTGCQQEDMVHQSHLAAWAVGVEVQGPSNQVERVIRGAFGFDQESGAIILQAAVAEGTKVMLHHRAIENVLNGTEKMASDLSRRLGGRKPWAVMGFECAARTFPFLGPTNTRSEHAQLRAAVAPEAPWFGMMAWGEIGPCAGRPAFHNYTYPLVVFTDERK
ncbi:MAG TPA: FIST N-terminal domain-containing protein [Polyangiaceae bacterium]|nr:FIST N-terminal domain-containing protein [Polyangiaceae bacterium]